MNTETSGYSDPVSDNGGIFAVARNARTGRDECCRLVVDEAQPGRVFWLHARAALRLNTDKPMGRLHQRMCPAWRWATEDDLETLGVPA